MIPLANCSWPWTRAAKAESQLSNTTAYPLLDARFGIMEDSFTREAENPIPDAAEITTFPTAASIFFLQDFVKGQH
jgi:hypothetical protein